MSANAVVIVGLDAVSPLGLDLEDQWRRLCRGESGLGPLTRFPVTDGFPVDIAGQVDPIEHLAYPFLKPRELARWPSPIFRYALLTVQRAFEQSGLEITPEISPRVAVTFSSAVGGMDAVLGADRQLMAEGRMPKPCVNPNACINMVGGVVSMHTRATGPISATVTACATGATSMIVGAMLLAQGKADAAICGAVDFALVEPIVAGFATMNGAFTRKEGEGSVEPATASRPFSIDRRGFVISEGAGCVILATEAFARAYGLKYGVEIAGWAMTSDAHHFVTPHLETVRRCIAQSIADAGIAPDRIDAVNAHATSTRTGDRVEWDALLDVFKGNPPPVTANKSMIGHAMGASSAIESIMTVKGMETGLLPPIVNYTPDPEIDIDCATHEARPLAQEYVLKNAFGFGGCNSCIVFRKRR
ncbi:MAG: beta-ketoacyl-[acyl-carrier-protein] synthase family protein [Desulfobacterales bacterium]